MLFSKSPNVNTMFKKYRIRKLFSQNHPIYFPELIENSYTGKKINIKNVTPTIIKVVMRILSGILLF